MEGAAGWSRGGQEERARARRARQRRKEGEREEGRGKEKKEKEEKKEKRKKMGKRKRKRKGGKRNKEREGASASALIAAAVGHAWCRSRVTRRPRAKQGWDSGRFGYRLGSSGYQEIRREMIQEGDRAQRQNKD